MKKEYEDIETQTHNETIQNLKQEEILLRKAIDDKRKKQIMKLELHNQKLKNKKLKNQLTNPILKILKFWD